MLYKRLIINGTEYLLAVSQASSGAPAAAGPGAVGVFYMDTDTGDLYKCTGGEEGAWVWEDFGAGGTGADGGYYTPSVTQPVANTMQVAFTASKDGMPAVEAVEVALPSGGDADYKLPVGGDELGGVKNGGNVVINKDGTMTAPESTTESVELDTTLTKEGVAADAKAVGDALANVGQPTDEQISTAVSGWLDEHPEATTTVADGAITPAKTSFMPENQDVIATLDDVKVIKAGIRSDSTYYYHAYMKNNGLSLNVEGLSKIVVKAFVSYINWIQTATEVTASGVSVLSSGYTTKNPSMYGATADTDAAEMREVEIDIAEGASYILIDFGLTAPTYVSVGVPNGTYRFSETVMIEDKINRPKNADGDYEDGADGQVLYANGATPYWGQKINPGDVSAKGTTFWGSDALNIKAECEELPRIEVPWKYAYTQKTGSDGNTFYYQCVKIDEPGYVIHLKAGVEYVLLCLNQQLRYWKVDPRTAVLSELTDTQAANLEYNGMDSAQYKMLASGYAPATLGLYQNHGGKITPEEEIYLLVDDIETDTKWGVSGNFMVFEAEKVEYLKDLTGSEIYNLSLEKQNIYKEPFTYNTDQHYNVGNAYYNKYSTTEKMRRLIRQTDYLDSMTLSNFRLCFVGDSITYASSNAGLQRAFRKMVPYKLQVATTNTAIAGTCVTNGYGSNWSCGVPGVDGLLTDATYIQNVPANPLERPQIFVIALGTNDFGNNAPLGDVEAEDRDATFAGCYLKLVKAIRANYPKSGIILMCPFNRGNGGEANENGNILLDYSRVIHEIASFTPHTWVLDLSNHPIINYAGYPSAYVDSVHIGKYAHAVVSNELYRLIMEIVSISGFDYLPCLDNLNVGL